MTPTVDPQLVSELRRDEGVVKHAYQDHLGFWTVGVGRLIDERRGGGLSDEEINMLLENDIRRCAESIKNWPATAAVRDDPVRYRALLNMRFQLGEAGLLKFTNSLRAIAAKRWTDAAYNLRQSLWYRQTPDRAERVIQQFLRG